MRPYWKGYLKLALVSCPIALHSACSTSERIAFRHINKVTGHRHSSGIATLGRRDANMIVSVFNPVGTGLSKKTNLAPRAPPVG